jgi:hypothetical protein
MFGNYRNVIVGLVFLFVSGLAFGASRQNCSASAHDREVDVYADVSVLV